MKDIKELIKNEIEYLETEDGTMTVEEVKNLFKDLLDYID